MKTGTAPILVFATFSIVGFVALPRLGGEVTCNGSVQQAVG